MPRPVAEGTGSWLRRLGAAGVVVGACTGALACAAPRQADSLARVPRASSRPDDASPAYYAPDEVDAVARLVTPIAPPYPPSMRARRREGDVVAKVLVRADGSVAGAELIEASDAAFTDAARAQIREARFAPALRGGAPVASWVIVRVRFRLA